MTEYAALSKTPHALTEGLMLVFQHPGDALPRTQHPLPEPEADASSARNGNPEFDGPSP
jgi:hypothetical protein